MNTKLLTSKLLYLIALIIGSSCRVWAVNLAPRHVIMQTGGGMGIVSAGAGWSYGGNHWETELILGLVPKYDSKSAKLTVALKQNFVPWRIRLNSKFDIEPLTASIYLSTLASSDLWVSQPARYPTDYYILSTKIRANISIGQRIGIALGSAAKPRHLWAFYEIGTCDIYVLNAVGNSCLSPKDWLQLCLGIKFDF